MLLQLSKTVKQSPKSPQIFENNGAFCADRPFSKNRSETNCQKSFVFNQLVSELQSYILSTTTETPASFAFACSSSRFNRTSFQQQLKRINVFEKRRLIMLQSYILSTTTETVIENRTVSERIRGFNRTSFQQQLKLLIRLLTLFHLGFNRTSFQQQLKHWVLGMFKKLERLQSYILSTTTETIGQALNSSRSPSFNRTSFQQQLKQNVLYRLRDSLRLQSYILSTTTETLAHDVFYVFRVASIVHPFNNN